MKQKKKILQHAIKYHQDNLKGKWEISGGTEHTLERYC